MKVTFEIYGKQEGISSSRRIQLISKNADGAITSFRELSATGLGSNLIQVSDRNKHNTTQITTEEASRLINIAVENNDIYIIQHKKDKIEIEYAYFCNVGTIDQKLRHLLMMQFQNVQEKFLSTSLQSIILLWRSGITTKTMFISCSKLIRIQKSVNLSMLTKVQAVGC